MKRALTLFFLTLGVIFFVLILILSGVYLFRDSLFPSLGGKPQMEDSVEEVGETPSIHTAATTSTNIPLTDAQEAALEKVGVDEETLQGLLTEEHVLCYTRILGASRVAEIKAGSLPTAIELVQVQSCF